MLWKLNTSNPAPTGLDRCQSIKYSGLSDSTYTDLCSYKYILLLLLYLGCITNLRSIPFGYIVHLLVQECQGPFLFFLGSSVSTRDAGWPGDCGSGVFTAEEVDGVGDKGSGDTTILDVETLLEDLQTWDYCWHIRISGVSAHGLKEPYCTLNWKEWWHHA
jgi:hypothetical protein